jgi:D-sorbitol dehydrogenase (acceptor)
MRLLTSLAAAALTLSAAPVMAQDAPNDPALIAKGEAVARAGDCAACHRAEQPGGKPFAGGYAIGSPMGAIIAPNITPSKTAGIGDWTFADFDRAMRKGVTRDGTHLYPAMPFTEYQGMSDADMKALYAYFQHGVAPVDVKAPETHLPFPFNIRQSMIAWDALFLGKTAYTPKPGLTAEQARGQYLVETLGHCGTCHTPRGMTMASDTSQALAGGDIGGWHAPNITSDPVSGIGGWSQAELVTYLKNGHVPGKGVAAGGMGEAVENSLSGMDDADLGAIASYLKVSTPVRDAGESKPSYSYTQPKPIKPSAYEPGDNHVQAQLADGTSTDGAVLYNGACAACHGVNGKGTSDDFYAPLVGSSTTGAANPANLIMTILNGVDRHGADGRSFMPAFAPQLNDAQVAAIANHVLSRFGRPDVSVTEAMVATARAGGKAPDRDHGAMADGAGRGDRAAAGRNGTAAQTGTHGLNDP